MFIPRTGPAAGRSSVVRLTAGQEQRIGFTPAEAREWAALQAESDSQLLASDLLRFAGILEERSQDQAAAAVYSLLLGETGLASQREKAALRLDSLQGLDSGGRRFERELRYFLVQATDPAMILGMTAAGLAGQTLHAATLAGLLSVPEANLLTRGAGAVMSANAAGFAAEVPALVLSSRGLRQLFGEVPSEESLARELARAGLQTFFLKAGGSLIANVAPDSLSSRALGMWGGLVVAQSTEAALGWKSSQSADAVLMDSLLFLGQLQIGAFWSRSLLGRSFAVTSEGNIPERFRSPDNFGVELSNPEGTLALAGEISPSGSESKLFNEVWMNSRSPEPLGGFASDSRRIRGTLGMALGKAPESESVEQLAESLGKIPEPLKTAYADLLTQSLPQVQQGSETPVAERMVLGATACFAYVEELNPLRRASGSFYDVLIQEFFERSLMQRDGTALAALIRTVSEPAGIPSLEKLFRRQAWQGRYGLGIFLDGAEGTVLPANWEKALQAPSIGGLAEPQQASAAFARRMIGDYLRAYHAEKIPQEWSSPAHNHLVASFGEGTPVRHDMGLPILARGLRRFSDLMKEDPAWVPVFSNVAAAAVKSPVPLLYFDRLFKLLATDGPIEKIGDLAYPRHFNLSALRTQLTEAAGLRNPKRAGNLINGKFETGFVSDLPFARKLARLYEELPALLDPEAAAQRRRSFQEQALALLTARARGDAELGLVKAAPNFLPVDLMDLLEVHPTVTSRHAREAFLQGRIDLQLFSYSDMQALWAKQAQSAVSRAPALSLFLPGPKSPTGRPLVALTETSAFAPLEEKARRALLQTGLAVHEYEHFSHHQELPFQHAEGLLRAELRASLEELHFLLKNGELSEWEKIRPLAGLGLGIYLRSRVEQDYLGEPRLFAISGR